MNIAIIGCGYVAYFYAECIKKYTGVKLLRVFDNDKTQLKNFVHHFKVTPYSNFQQLLDDTDIDLVLNLTNPSSHYLVNKELIESKHNVFSEKPLAMDFDDASHLVALAKEFEVHLACAPCNHLSPAAEVLTRVIKEGKIGEPVLVYASFEAGLTHKFLPWNWTVPTGAKWPAADEFTTGCTIEHAGYFVSNLVMLFGPIVEVRSNAYCLIPNKGLTISKTPDFTSANLLFSCGVVADVRTGMIAPPDRSIVVSGSEGYVTIQDIRDDYSAVLLKKVPPKKLASWLESRGQEFLRKLAKFFKFRLFDVKVSLSEKLKNNKTKRLVKSAKFKNNDFFIGPKSLLADIQSGEIDRQKSYFALHINEVVLALQNPKEHQQKMSSANFL